MFTNDNFLDQCCWEPLRKKHFLIPNEPFSECTFYFSRRILNNNNVYNLQQMKNSDPEPLYLANKHLLLLVKDNHSYSQMLGECHTQNI